MRIARRVGLRAALARPQGPLVTAVGRFREFELGASSARGEADGAFLDRKCRLLARIDAGGEPRGIRFAGPNVVLAVEKNGALELRWARP